MPLQVVARGNRLHHAAVGIEPERLRRSRSTAGRSRPRARADQAGEFVGAEREAAFAIHLPHEAQRQPARIRRRRVDGGFDGRRWIRRWSRVRCHRKMSASAAAALDAAWLRHAEVDLQARSIRLAAPTVRWRRPLPRRHVAAVRRQGVEQSRTRRALRPMAPALAIIG